MLPQQQIIQKGNQENKPIYDSIKMNIILRDKFNQGDEKSILKPTKHLNNKWVKIEINGKAPQVHRLEEIMLKCSYYPKPYINSMQPLSKFQ